MDSKAVKRRNWIKNIFIIFLSVMLFLTFFSNTIMNFSLPEVSAQYPSSGSITSRIRKSGNVAATEDYEVILGETRTLLGVEVKKGQMVAIGDLLFKLEAGESKEVENAVKAYEEAKVAYDIAQLDLDKDYTELQNAVNKINTKLSNLKKKKNNAGNNDELINSLRNEIKQLQREIDNYENKISEIVNSKSTNYSTIGKTDKQILDDVTKLYESAKLDYDKVKNDYEKANNDLKDVTFEKRELEKSHDKAVKNLEYFEANQSGKDITEDSLLEQRRAIEIMEIDRQRAIEELDLANNEWQRALESAYYAYVLANDSYVEAINTEGITQEDIAILQKALQDAHNTYNNLQSTPPSDVTAKQRAIEDLDIRIRNAREDLNRAEQLFNENQNHNTEYQRLKNAINTAKRDLDLAEEKLIDATDKEADMKINQENAEKLMNGYLILILKAEQSILKDEKQKKDDELSDSSENNNPVTDADIEAAEEELKSAQETLAQAKRDDNKSSTIKRMELNLQKKELERLQKEVDRLQKTTIGTEVKAKVAGMVSDINFVAGQEVDQNAVLAKIQIVDKGYYVEFDVTNEEATRIRPGEVASLQYYWGSDIEAVVESVKNSTSNPGKSKTVRLAISGEIEAGRQLTFNLGERGQNYDTIVPKSAIREDSNGKFILTVVSKSTPLGNRYTAVRADITVLAEDDTNSAISLSLYGNEFIITTSTKPIKDGDQVRLVDR